MPIQVLLNPQSRWVIFALLSATLVACSDDGSLSPTQESTAPETTVPGNSDPEAEPTDADTNPDATPPSNGDNDNEGDVADNVDSGNALLVPDDLFTNNGYGNLDVIRLDVRTNTLAGVCSEEDQSGCTLDDVLADINGLDEIKIDIPIHLASSDYPDDGSSNNAELRQRGATARTAPQKSFRVKLDKEVAKWRNERYLQLNKHFFDQSRIRNKLSFDLMSALPDLPSSRTQFVNLWVDDGLGAVDYGLFTHVEKADKQFLENRNWNSDDRIYKVEFFEFSNSDLAQLAIDDSGKPVDEDRFESRLGIETGKDHSQLIAMLQALNDPQQDFAAVFDRYFDPDNVLAWVTVNFMLGQRDAISNNFYLFNPVGSEKIYFMPWDYDSDFYTESELIDDDTSNAQLLKRLNFGYARGSRSVFLDNYYRLPGIHSRILSKAEELRNSALSNERITSIANAHASTVRPYLFRSPDFENLPGVANNSTYDAVVSQLPEFVTTNLLSMKNDFAIPLSPVMQDPSSDGNSTLFSWSPAHDVTGHTLTYDLEVSTSVNFAQSDIVYSMVGLPDSKELVTHAAPTSELPSGTLYYRVIARSSLNPVRFWQVARNAIKHEGTTLWGMTQFTLP